jgi:hypothetical protein
MLNRQSKVSRLWSNGLFDSGHICVQRPAIKLTNMAVRREYPILRLKRKSNEQDAAVTKGLIIEIMNFGLPVILPAR